jgi:hypothetical protein
MHCSRSQSALGYAVSKERSKKIPTHQNHNHNSLTIPRGRLQGPGQVKLQRANALGTLLFDTNRFRSYISSTLFRRNIPTTPYEIAIELAPRSYTSSQDVNSARVVLSALIKSTSQAQDHSSTIITAEIQRHHPEVSITDRDVHRIQSENTQHQIRSRNFNTSLLLTSSRKTRMSIHPPVIQRAATGKRSSIFWIYQDAVPD